MRVVFMGTPAFSIPVLEALLAHEYQVAGVYTQPDKPSGRGKRLEMPPVKRFALDRGLSVFQPVSLRRQEVQQQLASLMPDAIIVAAYGKFLPVEVLDLPPLGCLNLHPSLLPRYRGPSPVVSAILAGDDTTGITIIRLDEGMDTGPILAQRQTPVEKDEDAATLTTRLFRMGADLLVETLPLWAKGEIRAMPQDDAVASISRLISKEAGEIDWHQPAVTTWRQVRAYQPWPGCYTYWRGQMLKVLEASPLEGQPPERPGTVVSPRQGGVGVATGQGVLLVQRLQLAGRRAVSSQEFIQGYRDFVGSRLPS